MKKRPDPSKLLKKATDHLVKKVKDFPKFAPGDTIRVYVKVKEGEKTRVQPYEGVVIKMRKGGERSSFTVRKMSSGVGVERVFPHFSPVIDRIMVISRGEVRRAKLFYLRGLRGRKGRIKGEYVYEDTVSEPQPTAVKANGETEVSAKAAQG
jgi:large subunit ribosomal protein L19